MMDIIIEMSRKIRVETEARYNYRNYFTIEYCL